MLPDGNRQRQSPSVVALLGENFGPSPSVFEAELLEFSPQRGEPLLKRGNDVIADLGRREGYPVYKPTPTIDLIFGADDHLIGIAIHGDEALRLLDLLHQISDGHALVSIGGLGDRAQRCSNILPEAGWRQLSSDPRRLIDQAERLTRSRNGIGRTVFQRCGAPPRMQAGSLYPKARFAWPAVRKPPLSRHPALLRHDSPLEETGFEPSVPLGAVSRVRLALGVACLATFCTGEARLAARQSIAINRARHGLPPHGKLHALLKVGK